MTNLKAKIMRAPIYMGIAFRLITPSFFMQFQIFLYPDTQETESFQMSPYFHGLGLKIKMTSVAPIYGQARSPRPMGALVPKPHQKVPLWVVLVGQLLPYWRYISAEIKFGGDYFRHHFCQISALISAEMFSTFVL